MTDIPTSLSFTGDRSPPEMSRGDLLETIRQLRAAYDRAFALNAHQHCRQFHPYTCGNDSKHRPLIATLTCWRCADCAYTQQFATGQLPPANIDGEVEVMFGLLKDGKVTSVPAEAVSP